MVEVGGGVQGPEVGALASFDIEDGHVLTSFGLETEPTAGGYPVTSSSLGETDIIPALHNLIKSDHVGFPLQRGRFHSKRSV